MLYIEIGFTGKKKHTPARHLSNTKKLKLMMPAKKES